MEKKRAILYARVSTDEQAREGFSLPAQLKTMRTFCELNDYQIVGEYVDDGYSGRNIHRKAYKEMFSSSVRGNWDVLVVLKMDRIHRNSKNFMAMMDDLRKHDQEFVSTMDKINTSTAVGRFVMDMIQRIAQLESEQIGERTYLGMKEKAVTGDGIMGFPAPFGYSFDNGKLVSNGELPTVKEIFYLYEEGHSLNEISNELNTAGKLTRKGNGWNKYNLRQILHNPVYAGFLRWDGILSRHDAETAVTPVIFNSIQLKMCSKIHVRGGKQPELLTT